MKEKKGVLSLLGALILSGCSANNYYFHSNSFVFPEKKEKTFIPARENKISQLEGLTQTPKLEQEKSLFEDNASLKIPIVPATISLRRITPGHGIDTSFFLNNSVSPIEAYFHIPDPSIEYKTYTLEGYTYPKFLENVGLPLTFSFYGGKSTFEEGDYSLVNVSYKLNHSNQNSTKIELMKDLLYPELDVDFIVKNETSLNSVMNLPINLTASYSPIMKSFYFGISAFLKF